MPIRINSTKRLFSIDTDHTSYQMMADVRDTFLHLYYGRKTAGDTEYLVTHYDRGFSGNRYDAHDDRTYSLDTLPQEYPVAGAGDFRSPALIVETKDGASGCDLRYCGHDIRPGKYSLSGLPAVYSDGEQDDAETLDVELRDPFSGLKVHLLYGVLPHLDIITRSVVIENAGTEELFLQKVQSASIDFVSGKYDFISFYGRHAMERKPERREVVHSAQVIGSRRGTSSHQYNPMMVLAESSTTETQGNCWAMQFVWSGGFTGLVEKDQVDMTRLQLGLMDEKFRYPLAPGASFTAPEVIMSMSAEGLGMLSNNLQKCIRTRVCRGYWRDRVRPVLLNSWEACYFEFGKKEILALANEACDLGMDMLVMDDGWFGRRKDDRGGLGDWSVNEEKLGGTLKELADQVHGLGLMFGIWFEPEMVSEDSDLYRKHPDWALALPGRKPVMSRSQLVLDYSRKEVRDEMFRQMCAVLDNADIDYVKWDYNRSIDDVYSRGTDHQGTVLYDYMLGLYEFLEKLNRRYPRLLIEGCSGGGGRFDAGMLYYTPQIWCSDNTDAIDRLTIQYGTSFGYPAGSVGAHVSVSPNEQNGRVTPVNTRGVVAMSGTFGYELDPAKLSPDERNEIKSQIKKRNEYAELILKGRYFRLSNPDEEPVCAWEHMAEDGSELLISAVMTEIHGNAVPVYIKPQGLVSGAVYRDTETGGLYPADALMDSGFPLPVKYGEYQAYQTHLQKV